MAEERMLNDGFDSHRRAMIELAREVNARAGIVDDPSATAEKAQQMMRDLGIHPEDNLFSRGIICARYGTDESNRTALAYEGK